MKYNRFEELPVWQDAIQLAVQIFDLTSRPEFKGYFTLKNQIERAGVSVSNNIAEGFERGTTQETLTFLYISRGSSGEVRSLTHLIEWLGRFIVYLKKHWPSASVQQRSLDNYTAGAIHCKSLKSKVSGI